MIAAIKVYKIMGVMVAKKIGKMVVVVAKVIVKEAVVVAVKVINKVIVIKDQKKIAVVVAVTFKKNKKKWHQGRDRMKDDLSQIEKNDILRASFEKHFLSWKKECPQLEHIEETTQEVGGVLVFQMGCGACMAYVPGP